LSTILVQVFFGWPMIILSLAVSVAGILKKWSWMLVLGGVLGVPFSVYLTGFTTLRFFAFLLPFFQIGAAWAVRAKLKILPWILLLPLASIMFVLAIIVLSQHG